MKKHKKQVSKSQFEEMIRDVETAKSVRDGIVYHYSYESLPRGIVAGHRESTGNAFEIKFNEILDAYNELNCIALFGPPDKTLTEALQGLAYAREQDLQTPQEIEWKAAERRSAIRRARVDYDQSALEAALEEWRKLQALQTSILAMDYAAKWEQTREPGQER